MTMQTTSLEAFESILPKINSRQELILTHLYWAGPETDAMLGASVKLPINCITPRRGELVKLKLVESYLIAECKCTHGTANYWRITQKGREVVDFKRRMVNTCPL